MKAGYRWHYYDKPDGTRGKVPRKAPKGGKKGGKKASAKRSKAPKGLAQKGGKKASAKRSKAPKGLAQKVAKLEKIQKTQNTAIEQNKKEIRVVAKVVQYHHTFLKSIPESVLGKRFGSPSIKQLGNN